MAKFALGRLFFTFFTLASWILVSSCAARPLPTRSSVPDATHLKGTASLNIFSGRADPGWDLPDTTTAALVTELNQLKATPALEGLDPDSRLGYRGFRVGLTDQTSGAVRHLAIYLGGIVETGMQTKYYVDPDRTTEKLLLESARPQIDPDVYTYVESEIKK